MALTTYTPTLPPRVRRVRSVMEILILGSACLFGLIFWGRPASHVPDAVAPVAFSRTGDFTIWTIEAERVTGIKAKEIAWKPLWRFVPANQRLQTADRWERESARSYQTTQTFELEHEGRSFRLSVCMGGDCMALGTIRRR